MLSWTFAGLLGGTDQTAPMRQRADSIKFYEAAPHEHGDSKLQHLA